MPEPKPVLLHAWTFLNCFPPSVNHMIQSFGGNRFCSPVYKVFKENIALQMYTQRREKLKQYQNSPLSLAVYFHNNRFWRKKDGVLRLRYDVSNVYKAVEDSIFNYIEIDDSRNVEPRPIKRKQVETEEEPYMVAKLYLLPEGWDKS